MSQTSSLSQSYSKLLIHESPLQVLPSLAAILGLNEAIVLQQIHYWISDQRTNNIIDGRRWVYNTYDQWGIQFPFWGRNTIIRAIESLERKKLIISGSFNKLFGDRTKWYTIDYEKINSLDVGLIEDRVTHLPKMGRNIIPNKANEATQNGNMRLPKMGSRQLPKMGSSSTIDYTETTSKITTETNIVRLSDFDKKFEEFWNGYDNKKGREKCYKAYKSLLEDKGVNLHDNIMYAISEQRAERDSADALGLWQPARKMPLTWLNAHCWEDGVKTQGQLNEERQREVSKLSRRPQAMSATDRFHQLNESLRETADRKLAEINAEIRARGEEPDEDDEIDF